MAVLRAYRNIEYSFVDYITAQLTADSWSGVSVAKNYKLVEDGALPVIVVNMLSSNPKRREVGSLTLTEEPTVVIRIFALNDGQRLDLAKWLIDKLSLNVIPFYTYTIVSGSVTDKTANGYISVLRFNENRKEYDGETDLEPEDRYRHKISIDIRAKGVS